MAGAGRSLGYVNAPSLFQQVTSLCCDMTSDLKVYEENCRLLTSSLREMGYHVAQPGGAFYLFPRSLEPDDLSASGPRSSTCCWSPAPASAPPAMCASPTVSRPR